MEIASLVHDWKLVRAKTLDFLEQLPEDKMQWRPDADLGTFGMQFRHLGKIHEAYLIGLKTGRITFTDKSFDPAIEESKRAALQYLEQLEKDMLDVLAQLDEKTTVVLVDASRNEQTITLQTTLFYLTNHEIYHQGIFTVYARLAGLGKIISCNVLLSTWG